MVLHCIIFNATKFVRFVYHYITVLTYILPGKNLGALFWPSGLFINFWLDLIQDLR